MKKIYYLAVLFATFSFLLSCNKGSNFGLPDEYLDQIENDNTDDLVDNCVECSLDEPDDSINDVDSTSIMNDNIELRDKILENLVAKYPVLFCTTLDSANQKYQFTHSKAILKNPLDSAEYKYVYRYIVTDTGGVQTKVGDTLQYKPMCPSKVLLWSQLKVIKGPHAGFKSGEMWTSISNHFKKI